jgi:hypothetical protein
VNKLFVLVAMVVEELVVAPREDRHAVDVRLLHCFCELGRIALCALLYLHPPIRLSVLYSAL